MWCAWGPTRRRRGGPWCWRTSSLEEGAASASRYAHGPGAETEVWATVGLHPHDAKEGLSLVTEFLDELSAGDGFRRSRVVAIGECGLDYYYDNSPREVQRDVFAAQVALANRYSLALVIHTREAWDDTFSILEHEGVPPRTIFHCFTGGSRRRGDACGSAACCRSAGS